MTDTSMRMEKRATVLIIDDEEKLRMLLARLLQAEGFEVVEAKDGRSGLKKVEQGPIDAVLCDVKLPDGSGVNLIAPIRHMSPFTEVVLLTAHGNLADSVQAMKNGAFDYIVKGDDNDRIIPLLYRAIEKAQLHKKLIALEKRVGEKYSFDSIIGKSKPMQQAIMLAEKVAPTNAAVLLTGETGVGKEVFAQAIHQASPRAQHSFVALNCSVFSREILESELFGHKQGAFTGAVRDQKGLIEEADGGTLFLDEIGEMPLELQAKLLRVLETNEFIKLGDTKPSHSNFRLIAATNRDLRKESEEKRFRSDLYFRLNVFEIELPPLRERKKDIEAIARHFISVFATKMNKKIEEIDPVFWDRLENYPWHGNIRELKNIIERAIILSYDQRLSLDCLPYDMQQASVVSHAPLSAFAMASVEKLHIQKVLNHTHGNKAEAARLLEIGIATLYRKIEQYRL